MRHVGARESARDGVVKTLGSAHRKPRSMLAAAVGRSEGGTHCERYLCERKQCLDAFQRTSAVVMNVLSVR